MAESIFRMTRKEEEILDGLMRLAKGDPVLVTRALAINKTLGDVVRYLVAQAKGR